MIAPHAYHTATLLPNGGVLVAGGLVNDRLDGKVTAAAELFDPSSGKWTATRAMLGPRWGHTATLLPDGKVLVAGSYVNSSDPLASAELYDPSTGRWTAAGRMTRGRGGHTATLLLDGRVLVVGGGAEDTQLEGGPRSATRPSGRGLPRHDIAPTVALKPTSGSFRAKPWPRRPRNRPLTPVSSPHRMESAIS